ncbi:MAG TPA: hypothetical protein VHT73_05800 [Thermodesulfobacteriota bacterium]|nr:hypothetical protein [Thermodesulfobacteriota bacterium]
MEKWKLYSRPSKLPSTSSGQASMNSELTTNGFAQIPSILSPEFIEGSKYEHLFSGNGIIITS